MIKTIPFKLSFKIFQWMLVLLIAFSTYLGYQFFQVTIQAQKIENQRFWVISQLSAYRSRIEKKSYLSRQYQRSNNSIYLTKYNEINIANENGLSTSTLIYTPLSANERILWGRAKLVDGRLRGLEADAFYYIKHRKKYPSRAGGGSVLFSGEYVRLNLALMTIINKLLESVNNRFQQKISHIKIQQTGLIYTIPSMLAVNLVLLLFTFVLINRRMKSYHKELKSLTIKDFLTGVHNRKYLMETGPLLISLNQREQTQVAVLMLDIDKFKLINDHYGHDAGDDVLIAFSHTITHRLRKGDIFSRFGGEEFILILNKVTEADAEHFANEVRDLIGRQKLSTQQGDIDYTVSIGVVMSDDVSSLNALITLADKALYQAKNSGRNKVIMIKSENFPIALSS